MQRWADNWDVLTKKWTGTQINWGPARGALTIIYPDRLRWSKLPALTGLGSNATYKVPTIKGSYFEPPTFRQADQYSICSNPGQGRACQWQVDKVLLRAQRAKSTIRYRHSGTLTEKTLHGSLLAAHIHHLPLYRRQWLYKLFSRLKIICYPWCHNRWQVSYQIISKTTGKLLPVTYATILYNTGVGC